ncbi:MAG: hypothetical protein AAF989_11655 [Planctomycetota bacterium]
MFVGPLCAALLCGIALPGLASAVDILATAIPGEPYGIASIEIPLEVPIVGDALPPLKITEADGRVFYPIAEDTRVKVGRRPSDRPVPREGRGRLLGRLGNLIREITSEEEELEQTVSRRISFLFSGSDPLAIRLSDSRGALGVYDITPVQDPAARAILLQSWWSEYTAAAKRQVDAAKYRPYVENYLVAMLAGRLNLPLPPWYLETSDADQDLTDTLKLIGGASDVGQEVFRRAAAGRASNQTATLPLPAPPAWESDRVRGGLDHVETEPMASAVPPECFYIRYGSFTNYLWFRDLSEEYGGDISQMVTLAGVNQGGAMKLETQLHLQSNELSRMLGPTVIEDQALIGRDLFLNDGATMGVMFKPINAFLLRTSLNGDRSNLAKSDETVSLTEVKIAGETVSLLRSPDNRIRSYLAEAGGFILVANSETLVRRFIEVADSGASLAATPSFRLARQLMPLDRNDTIFAYLSPLMLQGLVAPETLIELRRRMHAEADIALVEVARLTAAGEGNPIRSIDELIDAGYLPQSFSRRSDQSSVFDVGGQIVDTRRGARGSFLPIADANLDSVTAEEAAWYQRISDFYSARFRQLDPIMAGVVREVIDEEQDIERITAHIEIAPWNPDKYGDWARQLGPPTNVTMEFAPDDIVAMQAHVASEKLGPPTHLFAGVKDSIPPNPEDFDGIISTYRALKGLPGYLGAWPLPGALDRLPLGLGRGTPVGPNMSRLIGGIYRYTGGGFSVLSFYPDLLQASLPFMGAVETDDRAQIRIHVGNLDGAQLSNWVNAQLYERAAETSRTGANFLNLLSRQLQVPSDSAKQAADRILGGRLQDSLGGEYVTSDLTENWISSVWRGEAPLSVVPRDYTAPILKWFRGADAKLTQYADRVVVDAVVDVQR